MSSAGNAVSFTMREMRSEDLDVISSIYFAAFEADSIATGVPAGFRGADEAARGMIGAFLADPSIYKLVAVDVSGKLLGAGFMHSGTHTQAVGPVFVDVETSNKGIGKALMQEIVDHAKKMNAPSIRLTTSASNCKSFCIYVARGFRPVECTSSFFGTVPAGMLASAASSLGILTNDFETRKMEERDVIPCSDIHANAVGYNREDDIRGMLMKFPHECWVATSKDERIVGYTTGLGLLGHSVASSEAAWVAVISRAIEERKGAVSCLCIPGCYNPALIQWALAAKLLLARHNWYMVIGHYQKPNDGFVWCPSLLH